MALSLIAAIDRKGAIGRQGKLPWHLPDDLRRFKTLTMGHTVLMGYHTALSIGKALPGRTNLVLTRQHQAPYPGQQTIREFSELIHFDTDIFVIGGAEIYRLAMPQVRSLYLTEVDTEVLDADAFFPVIDGTQWQILHREFHPTDARHACAFTFIDYQRRAMSIQCLRAR